MTVTTLVSVKGAPGVTTLACLVGATWPDPRRVAVVEADPFGGDLAARFRLPTSRGWTSYVTATRRSGAHVPIEPHLQVLPGGLQVMIGTRGGSSPGPDSLAIEAALQASVSSEGGPWDLVVDGGRLLPTENLSGAASWLGHSDQVVVVVHRDAPSILNVRQHAQTLADRHESVVGLVIVGGGRLRNAAIEEFTGIPIVGEVPIDLRAAHAVSGGGGANRRLSRSSLVVSARRLAEALARPSHKDEKGTHAVNGDAEHDPVSPATTPAPRRAPRRLTGLHRFGRRRQSGETSSTTFKGRRRSRYPSGAWRTRRAAGGLGGRTRTVTTVLQRA